MTEIIQATRLHYYIFFCGNTSDFTSCLLPLKCFNIGYRNYLLSTTVHSDKRLERLF